MGEDWCLIGMFHEPDEQHVTQASVGHLNYFLLTKPTVMEVISSSVSKTIRNSVQGACTPTGTLSWVVGSEATANPTMWPFPKYNQIVKVSDITDNNLTSDSFPPRSHSPIRTNSLFPLSSLCSYLFSTIQEAFQIGIYWAHTNTVHKSTALKLVHDLTSPRWKEGSGSEVVTLDEEGYVEADITLGAFPGRQKVRGRAVKL